MARLYSQYKELYKGFTITPQLDTTDSKAFGKPISWSAKSDDGTIITAKTISKLRREIRGINNG